MTLTAIVGALMALVARPARPDKEDPLFIAGYDAGLKDGRREIESLEREMALAQAVLGHWREQAARLARENRELRAVQAMAQSQALQAQHNIALAQQAQQASMQDGRYLGVQSLGQQMQTFEGFCNCVPSRNQIWGAQHGLVQQLNTFLGD